MISVFQTALARAIQFSHVKSVTYDSAVNEARAQGVCVRYVDRYHDLLPLHKLNSKRYPHLLESVAHGTAQARFDILFAFPGDTLELTADFSIKLNNTFVDQPDVLDVFDDIWAKITKKCSADIPFTGGWFVYLAYELAALIEPTVKLAKNRHNSPAAIFTRIPAAIICDHQLKKLVLVAEENQEDLLEIMSEDLQQVSLVTGTDDKKILQDIDEENPGEYLESVEKVKRYINDGDVFQVNLSRLWQGRVAKGINGADIYQRLRQHNPAPFAGLATFSGLHVISSSPERLVKVENQHIETRPIAGTRPRGANQSSDNTLAKELMGDPKERAEHVMLIDLERNDLGRVCKPGSVKVDELMVLESYSHVHHIVSNVCGLLRENVTPGQVIRAVFPGGTITGCPKVRCMQILAELEQSTRGPYTGAMGYINLDGGMDLNILIRTMVLTGDRLELRAGGGIVADSMPDRELNETRAKARGLLLALGIDNL